jgi:hypothetical protein
MANNGQGHSMQYWWDRGFYRRARQVGADLRRTYSSFLSHRRCMSRRLHVSTQTAQCVPCAPQRSLRSLRAAPVGAA